MYKKIVAVFAITILFYSMPAYAHIMNATNMYSDIDKSPNKEAILYTHALNLIVTDTSLFKEEDKLSQKDFAVWYSTFLGLDLDEDEAIKNALDKGWINAEDEAMTYGQLNTTLFENEVKVKNENKELTRGAYADFIMAHAQEKTSSGKTLLDLAAVQKGPTGIISDVQASEGSGEAEYTLTIDGKKYQLAEHPSISNDSTDPLVWQGQNVVTSLLTNNAVADRQGTAKKTTGSKLQFLEIEAVKNNEKIVSENKGVQQEEQSSMLIWWLTGALVIIVLVVVLVFVKKNKRK